MHATARVFKRFIDDLRTRGEGIASPSDGDLLHRFACLRDEAAFAELLRRHGPLVMAQVV